MRTAQPPITPNSTYIESIIDILERIALNQQQICVETLSHLKHFAFRLVAERRASSGVIPAL
jgi:hypothetical protein